MGHRRRRVNPATISKETRCLSEIAYDQRHGRFSSEHVTDRERNNAPLGITVANEGCVFEKFAFHGIREHCARRRDRTWT